MTNIYVLMGLLTIALLCTILYYGYHASRAMVAFFRVQGSLMLAERRRCLGLVRFYADGMPHQNVYRRLITAIESGEQPLVNTLPTPATDSDRKAVIEAGRERTLDRIALKPYSRH